MNKFFVAAAALGLFGVVAEANATVVGYSACSGAVACSVTFTPPNPIKADPNNGILLGWHEMQNITLKNDLRVDRVADPTASFIGKDGSGSWIIKAGTIVSSHYFQWDPGNGSSGTVSATIDFDSPIFAFITGDQKLFDSDAALGLPGFNYADFIARGLEANDITNFNGNSVSITWSAGSPGDWTRLLTAYSPIAAEVPEPAAVVLLGGAFAGLAFGRRKQAR